MFLSRTRLLTTGVVALAAALAGSTPAQAAPTILISEVDGGGNVVGPTFTYTGGTLTTTNFSVGGFVSSNSTANVTNSSINSGFSMQNLNSLSSSSSIGLKIVITDTFQRLPGGGSSIVSTTAGASSGVTGFTGLNTVTAMTEILSQDGLSTLASTANATATSPGSSSTAQQDAGIDPIPADYQIRQTITVRLSTTEGIGSNQTFGAVIGSSATPGQLSAVPAPPALALALIALPVLGLRRRLTRKAV